MDYQIYFFSFSPFQKPHAKDKIYVPESKVRNLRPIYLKKKSFILLRHVLKWNNMMSGFT